MAARSAGKCRVEDLVSIHIPTTGGSLKETQGSVADDLEHGGQELPPDSPSAYVSTDQASSAPAQQIDTVKAAAAFETLSITLAQQSMSWGPSLRERRRALSVVSLAHGRRSLSGKCTLLRRLLRLKYRAYPK